MQSMLTRSMLLPSLLPRWMSSWFQRGGGIEAGPRDDPPLEIDDLQFAEPLGTSGIGKGGPVKVEVSAAEEV